NETGRDLTPMAQTAIEDLFEDAKHYGLKTWSENALPSIVRSQILRAAVRYMKNSDGFVQSRAGDETVAWGSDGTGMAGSAHFSATEISVIKDAAEGGDMAEFGSFGTYAWNSRQSATSDILVPTYPWGSLFPLYK